MFLNVPPKDKGGKKTKKQSTSGKDQGEDAHGILDGISSLHTWIKTQTMIRPHPKSRGGKQGAMYDEVNICKKRPVIANNKKFLHTLFITKWIW